MFVKSIKDYIVTAHTIFRQNGNVSATFHVTLHVSTNDKLFSQPKGNKYIEKNSKYNTIGADTTQPS